MVFINHSPAGLGKLLDRVGEVVNALFLALMLLQHLVGAGAVLRESSSSNILTERTLLTAVPYKWEFLNNIIVFKSAILTPTINLLCSVSRARREPLDQWLSTFLVPRPIIASISNPP